jgi:hypothetical protein
MGAAVAHAIAVLVIFRLFTGGWTTAYWYDIVSGIKQGKTAECLQAALLLFFYISTFSGALMSYLF